MKVRFIAVFLFVMLLLIGATITSAQDDGDSPPFATNTPTQAEATPETTPEPVVTEAPDAGVIVIDVTEVPPDTGEPEPIIVNVEAPTPDTDQNTLIVVGGVIVLVLILVLGGVGGYFGRMLFQSLPPTAQMPVKDFAYNVVESGLNTLDSAAEATVNIQWDDELAVLVRRAVYESLRDIFPQGDPVPEQQIE